MRKSSIAKRGFTLVELLVSMGVFSILLVLTLQFFAGAQRLWRISESRNRIYADARVTMDIMSTMLQATSYSFDGIPFYMNLTTPGDSKIYFGTASEMDLPGTGVRFVTFQRVTSTRTPPNPNASGDQLIMGIVSNDTGDPAGANYYYYFPPYDGMPTSYSNAITLLTGALDGRATASTRDGWNPILLNSVTRFEITPYRLNRTTGAMDRVLLNQTDLIRIPPDLIEIRISLMDSESYELWIQMPTGQPRDLFRQQNEHSFTRAVFIGNRWPDPSTI